jgi:hypothetical protein
MSRRAINHSHIVNLSMLVGFIMFSFYRCFLFGVTFSFLPQLLRRNLVGKGYGLVFLITGECLWTSEHYAAERNLVPSLITCRAGVINAIQIPLAHLAVQKLNGNFFVPNLVFTILILPCIAAAWGLGRCIQRENTTKQRLRASFGGGLLPQVASCDSVDT